MNIEPKIEIAFRQDMEGSGQAVMINGRHISDSMIMQAAVGLIMHVRESESDLSNQEFRDKFISFLDENMNSKGTRFYNISKPE